MATQVQLRRGTTLEWEAANPILAEGEIGIDLTLGAFKIGDGSHHWTEIHFMEEGPSGPTGPTGPMGASGPAGDKGDTGDSRFPSSRQSSPVQGDVFTENSNAYIYLADHWYQFLVVGPYFV